MRLFDMMTSEDIKRIKEDRGPLDLTKRIEDLSNSLTIALEVNDKYQRENVALKKRVEEAEGEVILIKGIGINSPEMRALQKENDELKKNLARAIEEHQYDNLVHEEELKKALKR